MLGTASIGCYALITHNQLSEKVGTIQLITIINYDIVSAFKNMAHWSLLGTMFFTSKLLLGT